MPRKKQGPRRLDEEEQRSSTFVMGGDVENNEQQNRYWPIRSQYCGHMTIVNQSEDYMMIFIFRELTERLTSAPAIEVHIGT